MLLLLCNCILHHGIVPKQFLSSVILPIPKNKKKSLNDSNNYRGIAIGNIVGTILDILIRNSNKHIFSSCHLQFGFKEHHSMTQLTLLVNEIII